MAVRDEWSNPNDGDQLDDGFFADIANIPVQLLGKNHIRTLINRAGIYSVDEMDGWGDAYIDSTGRNDGVDTGSTDATYDSDSGSYTTDQTISSITAGSDTLHNPDSATNTANAFDGNDSTFASLVQGAPTDTDSFGTTFSEKEVGIVKVKLGSLGANMVGTAYLQTYNGSTWSNYKTLVSPSNEALSYDDSLLVIGKIQGVRVSYVGTSGSATTIYIYSLEYGTGNGTSRSIYHDIPSGTFGSAISSSLATFIANTWEGDASVDYKLTNTGGDDSGWLTSNVISTFTAFSNGEPDTLIVRLNPSSSSPTTGFPSIKGAWVIAR